MLVHRDVARWEIFEDREFNQNLSHVISQANCKNCMRYEEKVGVNLDIIVLFKTYLSLCGYYFVSYFFAIQAIIF